MVKGRKGVSPLIAAVLLIAFTMAIAAILTAWVTTFTTERKEQSEAFSEQIECSGQNFRVESDFTIYYPNIANKTFETRIRNTGIIDVYIDEYRVWTTGSTVPEIGHAFTYQEDGAVVTKGALRIPKQTILAVNISGLTDEPEKVQFLVSRCEGVYSTINKPREGWTIK